MAERVSLLSIDGSLAKDLSPRRRAIAERDLAVRVRAFGVAGSRTVVREPVDPGGLGLLVVSGHLLRTLQLAHRAGAEILGPGDLLRPWQDDGEHSVYPFSDGWLCLDRVMVAVLDHTFTTRLAPFPEINSQLTGRSIRRSRRTVGQMVVAQLASVEHRILITLWHLADEWGTVHPDGIHMAFPLTHEQLGLLVGARRPAVTTALGRLVRKGLIRQSHDCFVLSHSVPENLPLLRGAGSEPDEPVPVPA